MTAATIAGLAVERIDPLDELTLAGVHRLLGSAAGVPDSGLATPCPLDLTGSLRFAWPGQAMEDYLARQGGWPVGLLRLLVPVDERQQVKVDQLVVHPDRRRRGIGRALFSYAATRAAAHGRDQLTLTTVRALPDGPSRDPGPAAFARALGGVVGGELIRARLTVPARSSTARLTCPAGYSLVHWGSVVPPAFLADAAELEQVTPTHVRDFERMRTGRQRRAWQAGVRDQATGRLVGWTSLSVTHSSPDRALQGITVVHHDHRGRRLGANLKRANLAQARGHEPRLREIETYTVAGNDPIARLNETMGFRPVDRWLTWRYEVGQ